MTRRRIIIVWVMLFLVAALIFMPLRLIIGGQGVSARKVEGIIWDGSIRDLRVGQLRVGDVNARLHALPLLLGRAKVSLSRGDAPFAPGIYGSFTRGFGGLSVDVLKASLPVNAIFAPLPAETLEVQDFSVRFAGDRCVEASGTVRLSLGNMIPGLDLSNGLLGKPRCDRGQLLLVLTSQSAMEHFNIRLSADGDYTATVFLEGEREDQKAVLYMAGFRTVANGYQMVRKGRF
ncbi:type II secretion system protein N [Sphingorhabdus sp. IMCC26285]|uniref:Type II secretion system protein N n=1 Tax=Sphingorhabdus profundilacus TaxID=2509718 RepID=A0A6I4LWE3_9SPHN|nr:type II secretion system protein N [Sphingorhabdus profundilacus]